MLQRLNTKHKMLSETLKAADREKRGTLPVSTLKEVLVNLNVTDKSQLEAGQLDSFLKQHESGGMVNYTKFADSIKAQDVAQLKGLPDKAPSPIKRRIIIKRLVALLLRSVFK